MLVLTCNIIFSSYTEQEVCMGESWPRSWVQTKRSEVYTHEWGQDSPIPTDLARLIRCLLLKINWQRRKLETFIIIRLFGTSINDWEEEKEHVEHFRILVCYFFNAIWNWSRCWSKFGSSQSFWDRAI